MVAFAPSPQNRSRRLYGGHPIERKGLIPLRRAQNLFKESNDCVVNARVERISGDLAGRPYSKSVQLSPCSKVFLGDSHDQPGIT